ncbi:MAG: hypothetical protein ACYTGW_16985 [Planctomycetota bacterium]|jgi:hypothetical protein
MKSALAGTGLLLAAPLLAQVAPPGYDTKEGETACTIFGAYETGRFQHMEGTLRGKTSLIRRIGFRLDNHTPSAFSAMGRTWTDVWVHLCHCDIDKRTASWNQNRLDAPVLMFRAKCSWPTYTKRPPTSPAAFEQALSFPFTSVFVYRGANDLLVEYWFLGGVMANKAAWKQTSPLPIPIPSILHRYQLDSANTVTSAPLLRQAGVTLYGSNSCLDSAHANPAMVIPDLRTYSKAAVNAANADSFLFELRSYFTSPNKTAMHALGLQGSSTGINVGACNKLHLTPLVIYLPKASGITSAARTNFGNIPYDARAAGLTLWTQAAWADSSTGRLSLTKAASVVVPVQPPAVSRRFMLYHWTATWPTGTGPSNHSSVNPIIQYSLK